MPYWLVKQEPADFPWSSLAAAGRTVWDGVRNAQARNHLRAMAVGDEVFYYHTGTERAVVGLARVVRAAFPDPTAAAGEDWVAVELAAVRALPRAVPLSTIRAHPVLRGMALVRQGRLSVLPVADGEAKELLRLAGA